MATVYSGWVAQDDYRVRLDYSVSYPNATQATVTMTAYIDAQYGSINGWTMYADISCDGQSRQLSRSGFSAWTLTNMGTVSFTVNRGSSARNVGVSCRIYCPSAGGSYASGATASGTASISGISYSAPAAPSGCAASRASDSQAKVTWSNGATGTTTPRSAVLVERQTDSGGWSQVASLGASATNWTDNSISADHRYAYRVRSQGAGGYSGYSTSGYIYTTPASPSSVTATKTGAQSVQLEIAGAAAWAESYGLERTADGGSTWQACGTATSFPWVDPSAPAGAVRYRVRAVRGDLASAWAESNSVTTITPPIAPSLSGLPAVAATGTALAVSWVPNHPDGSEQTQAQVEYQVGSAASVTADVAGSTTTYALPSTATASAGTVKVRVRTHGLDEDWGAWSAWVSVRVAVAPQAHFTSPAVDGATVAALPLAVAWEAVDATGISSQTLQLLGADGSVLLTRQLAGDARSLRIDDSVYALSNLTGYTLRLTVLGGSSLSTVAARSFTTDWAEPSQPTAELETDPADLSCAVTVHAGGTEGTEASVAEVPAGKTVGGAVVYGSTRQNLWVNPSGTGNGSTITENDDGSLTINNASEDGFSIVSEQIYTLRPGRTYTASVDKAVPISGFGFFVQSYNGTAWATISSTIGISTNTRTFEVPDDSVACRCGFQDTDTSADSSGTYRVMLNEGSEPEPWCPPGLNSVEELSIVTAGKNLLPPVSEWSASGSYVRYIENPFPIGTQLVGRYGGNPSGLSGNVRMEFREEYRTGSTEGMYSSPITSWATTSTAGLGVTVTARDRYICLVTAENAAAYFNQMQVQLEFGSTATAYEPPSVTVTPVDLDGHALNSLPDGTRDELRIDGTGAVTLVQRVGVATAPAAGRSWRFASSLARAYFSVTDRAIEVVTEENGWCDKLPMLSTEADVTDPIYATVGGSNACAKHPSITNTSTAASIAGGATYLYPLAEPVEIELPPAAVSFDGPGHMWADANVPATVKPVYTVGSSFSVTRILPDGSQWLVADGLTDGQGCIDPLPPLNVPFSYLVTAYAETGVSSAADIPVVVDSDGMEAFNFGRAAETAFTLGFDATGTETTSHAGETFRFALGPDTAQLPTFYADGDIDVSGTHAYVTYDHDLYRRIKSIVRDKRNAVCWFRDALGGRARVLAAWSWSYDAKRYRLIDVSATLTEVVWEDPSNG